MTTFALFTKGVEDFEKAYKQGLFDKFYSTNLAYVPEEYKTLPWFHSVDCSKKASNVINNLNEGKSIRNILNGKEETACKVKTLRKEYSK